MGLLSALVEPLRDQFAFRSTAAVIGAGLIASVILLIIVNVLVQLIFKNPNEPPVVFHWVPFIGSTITYGINPYNFFFACRKKVCGQQYSGRSEIGGREAKQYVLVWRCLHLHSARQESDGLLGSEGQ